MHPSIYVNTSISYNFNTMLNTINPIRKHQHTLQLTTAGLVCDDGTVDMAGLLNFETSGVLPKDDKPRDSSPRGSPCDGKRPLLRVPREGPEFNPVTVTNVPLPRL